MKNNIIKNCLWLLSLVSIFSLGACTKDEEGVDASVDGITISNVVAAYNSVTFDVVATDAIAIAYIAVEKGTTLTAQEVFDQGDAKGSTEGTFTYKGNGLNSDTAYTLYVAAKNTSGNIGPAAYDFTTAVNTGAPSSSEAAGIRVVDLGSSSLIWEVTNGSEVDFSLTMVQASIVMENELYEASKSGVDEETYLKSFMSTEDYAYIMGVTTGADEVASFNYEELYSTYPMYPGGNYTIYVLACKGDYEDYSTLEVLELTKLDIIAESVERIGNPFVEVTHKYSDYIGIYHTITPNEDTKYWAKFFTQTSELVEYVDYFDGLYGEGAGRLRLKEYVQQIDPYVTEQYGACDLYLNLDWGYEGIDFSRLAVGFDANLVPGDDYDECISQVLKVGDTDPGRFTVEVDSIGAGNFRMKTTLGENCKRVYWKLVDKGTYDDTLADESLAMALAYTLDAEGWVEFRANPDGSTEDNSNAETQDTEITTYRFVWSESTDTELEMIATSLNYEGVLSYPTIVASITTLPRTMGDFEPSITISAEPENISKTNILINYKVHDDAYDNDERLLYSRFLSLDDPENVQTEYTDDEMREWMIADDCAESNAWMLYLIDSDYPDSSNYSINWAAMDPDTNYRYYYCTENGKGEVSKLRYVDFKTMNNDGGDNPAFTINVDPDSIVCDEFEETFDAEVYFVPNGDVVSFSYLQITDKYLESQWYNTTTLLAKGLYQILMSEGMGNNVESVYTNALDIPTNEVVYAVVQGQGAGGVESMLSYVRYTSEGVIDEQVDVDVSEYITTTASAPAVDPYPVDQSILLDAQNLRPASIQSMAVAPSTKSNTQAKISEEQAAELRKKGVPFYTMREIGRNALLKENLK